jgi:membrane-bound inhibitor of C-type lysozyme
MPRWIWFCACVAPLSSLALAAEKTYVCKDDTTFVVEALETQGPQRMVKVSRDGRSDVLRWVQTQRDAYYSNGRTQFWDNGYYATLKRRNFPTLLDCELKEAPKDAMPADAPDAKP